VIDDNGSFTNCPLPPPRVLTTEALIGCGVRNKKAPTLVGASWEGGRKRSMRVENAEPASWNKRHHVAAAESQIGIRRKSRVLGQIGHVVVRINWIGGEVTGPNRIVGRDRSRNHLVNTNTGPG